MGLFVDYTPGLGITNAFSNNFANGLANGTITLLTPTQITIDFTYQVGNVATLVLEGTGLNFSGGFFSGTIDSFDLTVNGNHLYTLSNINVLASVFGANLGNAGDLFTTLYSGNDTFNITDANVAGPRYEFYGGGGIDRFNMFDNFSNVGLLDGGIGNDTIYLNGFYSDPIVLDSAGSDATLLNIEAVRLSAGNDYTIVTDGGFEQPLLIIDGRALGVGDVLTVDGGFSNIYGVYRIQGGDANDVLIGADNNDVIFGNLGNDSIDGGDGDDVLSGRAGNDIFIGGLGNDEVIAGPGSDTIDLSHGGIDTASGSTGNDTFFLSDNFGADFDIDGGPGRDTASLTGFGNITLDLGARMTGIETFNINMGGVTELITSDVTVAANAIMVIDNSASISSISFDGTAETNGRFVFRGGSSEDLAFGGRGVDTLIGNGGDDELHGGLGADTLTGGTGGDIFAFSTALGATNVDTITDFNPNGGDLIAIDNAVFTAAGLAGVLSAAAFNTGAGAADASDRIIYNPANGALFYDADGTGAAAAIRFATLDAGLTLSASDFLVY